MSRTTKPADPAVAIETPAAPAAAPVYVLAAVEMRAAINLFESIFSAAENITITHAAAISAERKAAALLEKLAAIAAAAESSTFAAVAAMKSATTSTTATTAAAAIVKLSTIYTESAERERKAADILAEILAAESVHSAAYLRIRDNIVKTGLDKGKFAALRSKDMSNKNAWTNYLDYTDKLSIRIANSSDATNATKDELCKMLDTIAALLAHEMGVPAWTYKRKNLNAYMMSAATLKIDYAASIAEIRSRRASNLRKFIELDAAAILNGKPRMEYVKANSGDEKAIAKRAAAAAKAAAKNK